MAFVRKKTIDTRPSSGFEMLSTPEELVELAAKYNIQTSPINVAALAKQLGITVRYEPMADDDSGSLKKDKKTNAWIMIVNSLHHPNRQRFTIAHEIAHRVKHALNCNSFEDTTFFRNGDSNWMEAQANDFAAKLLMPESEFTSYIEKTSSSVEKIAEHFQVSTMAVRIRAKQLGYEGHNL